MKVTIDIKIHPNGQIEADVIGGQGHTCISDILAGLEALVGEASTTRLKPEYEWEPDIVQASEEVTTSET